MSRRNSLEEKARKRSERAERHERAAFIQEAAKEQPEIDGTQVRFKNRKERRK